MQIIEDFIAARDRDVERDLVNRINIADLDAVEQLKFIIRRVATPQLRLPRYHRKLEEILVNLIGSETTSNLNALGNAEALPVISNNLDMAVRWICLEELTELEYLELEEEPSGSISIYGTSRLQ